MLNNRYFQFNMIKTFILIVLTIVITSCASSSQQPDEKGNLTGEPKSKINLFDSEKFDLNLGHSLSSQLPEVEVLVTTPFTTNEIPERIDKWHFNI